MFFPYQLVLFIISPLFAQQASSQSTEGVPSLNSTSNQPQNVTQNVPLLVTTVLTEPYVMIKSAAPNKTAEGNDRYEGYAVDLIEEISKIVGFNYTLKLVADGRYGTKFKESNGTEHWNGMIGELVSNLADLALADLTITSSRQEVVDFTSPFMNTGISILFKKIPNQHKTLISYLWPFSYEFYLIVLILYSLVIMESVRRERVTITSGLYYLFTYYLLTVMIISFYARNSSMAGSALVDKNSIKNAQDLSEQTDIEYGCVEAGSTRAFFQSSQDGTYKKIFNTMEEHQTYVKNNQAGIERVQQENFAFFMESASIEYVTEKYCDLTQIGSALDSKNYGIALKKGSSYQHSVSQAILQLQERGILNLLKNRWWKERNPTTCHHDKDDENISHPAFIASIIGILVVLVGVIGLWFILPMSDSLFLGRNGI